ncbi:unnamed protein product [Miscanthus lutarioriparius]|uniref:Uncharacterized protein n=1 Tax=Miscanthus lutarioriparius TaxID=422564 RepID=A0A811RCV2_9POAL|nr:unnamed protein product [Miscanthus lutarioriparius]
MSDVNPVGPYGTIANGHHEQRMIQEAMPLKTTITLNWAVSRNYRFAIFPDCRSSDGSTDLKLHCCINWKSHYDMEERLPNKPDFPSFDALKNIFTCSADAHGVTFMFRQVLQQLVLCLHMIPQAFAHISNC